MEISTNLLRISGNSYIASIVDFFFYFDVTCDLQKKPVVRNSSYKVSHEWLNTLLQILQLIPFVLLYSTNRLTVTLGLQKLFKSSSVNRVWLVCEPASRSRESRAFFFPFFSFFRAYFCEPLLFFLLIDRLIERAID